MDRALHRFAIPIPTFLFTIHGFPVTRLEIRRFSESTSATSGQKVPHGTPSGDICSGVTFRKTSNEDGWMRMVIRVFSDSRPETVTETLSIIRVGRSRANTGTDELSDTSTMDN